MKIVKCVNDMTHENVKCTNSDANSHLFVNVDGDIKLGKHEINMKLYTFVY